VYCGQLNALEGFAWIIWCVSPAPSPPRKITEEISFCRIIVTVLLIFVVIRGVAAARRGDGYRGQLVAA